MHASARPVILFLAWLTLPAPPEQATPKKAIKLVIDFGDGAQKVYPALAWAEGMTVLDALTAGQSTPHGIRFEHKGAGATAFVTRIDDVANQGGGQVTKNWLYRVNGQYLKKSCGICTLQAGDEVVWIFSVFPPH
jgi:hypothetical protein